MQKLNETTQLVILTLVRGLPGSGKSTFASALSRAANLAGQKSVVYSTDDFFVDDKGVYNFDGGKLGPAHLWNQKRTARALRNGCDVYVANTFTQAWEIAPYIDIESRLNEQGYNVRIKILDLFDGDGCKDEQLAARNTHGVPLDRIQAMRQRYEHDWVAGDFRPPWERKNNAG